jgi:hypothetical protein
MAADSARSGTKRGAPRASGPGSAPPRRGPTMARGSTLCMTMDFLAAEYSAAEIAEILGRLSPTARKTVDAATATDEVPYRVALELWRSTDRQLRDRDPAWVERAGAFAIERAGQRLYRGLLRKSSPLEFLTQQISLFQRYYRPGDMLLMEQGSGWASTRLLGFASSDALFCRRLTGGWRAALEITGGRNVSVRHPRCVNEGDLFCEWSLAWE